MTALTLLEAAALIGAIVTGILARQRRQELEATNKKLRTINQELRRRQEASSPDEDLSGYRTSLERSLGAPSAAHPVETYGTLQVSLARARRQVEQGIKEVKGILHSNTSSTTTTTTTTNTAMHVFQVLDEILQTSRDIKDARAERAVMRLRARALYQTGNLTESLSALERVLELSAAVGEGGGEGDVDTLGAMGDILAEMGNFEAAGKYYDLTIDAMSASIVDGNGNGNSSSSLDG